MSVDYMDAQDIWQEIALIGNFSNNSDNESDENDLLGDIEEDMRKIFCLKQE